MTQRIMRRGFLLLGIWACWVMPTVAAEVPFYWESIHVEIALQDNGDMHITEEQTYVFTGPHTTERYRAIALDKVDEITNASVSHEGVVLSASTVRKRGTFWMRWSHPFTPPASHTFTLRYVVKGGLRVYEKTDMVEWQALFPERDAPIQRGTVRLHLPAVLSGHIQEAASWGVPADVHHTGPTTVEFRTRVPIPPGEGLAIRVSFPHGLLQVAMPRGHTRDSTRLTGTTAYIVGVVLLIISVAGVGIAKRAYSRGRIHVGPVGGAEIGFGADGGGGVGGGGGSGGDGGGDAGG